MQARLQGTVCLFDELAISPWLLAEPEHAVLRPASQHDVGKAFQFLAHHRERVISLQARGSITGLALDGDEAVLAHPALRLEELLKVAQSRLELIRPRLQSSAFVRL